MRSSYAIVFAFIVSCGGGAPPAEHARVDDPPPPVPEAPAMSELQRLNARAREGAVVETLHGARVEDPYRSLEEDSPATREWVDAQSARTDAVLAEWRDPSAATRIAQLLRIGSIGGAQVAGNRLFYTKRDGDREQPALYVVERGQRRAQPRDARPASRLILDPLTSGERAALDWWYASPAGRYVAFGISQNGDERSTLRVLDVTSGRVQDDVIDHAKWSQVEWQHDERGFYYRRYPREGEDGYDAEHPDTYHLRVHHHVLGADPASDPLVFSPADGTDFPQVSLSDDDRWLVVNVYHGWSRSEVHIFDRGASPQARRNGPADGQTFLPIVTGQDHLYGASVHRGKLYVVTNEDAPRYRVMSAPIATPDRSAWTVLVPEGEGAIESAEIVGDRLAVHAIEDIAAKIRLYRLDGRADGEIALPDRGELFSFDTDPRTGTLAVGFSSFVHPPALYTWSTRDRALTEVDRVQTDLDLTAYQLSRERVPSRDGTPINVYFVHRRDLQRDGSNRVLLNGYGGFNVSLLPGFQRNALYWVERGGVYAVANLRGGGELGEDWHRAGYLGNKERVFEDFEAVIRWLASSRISAPERIAITGGSNGGLLMGAMITRCPDAFRATVANVGLYDMVRYHRFPPAELWIPEYGSAEDEAQFQWLHAYSPYHHVRRDVRYPAILITTADHDSRVHWAHSTKFAALLQEASGQADPEIWFSMNRQQGHGAGTRLSDTVDRYVELYTFVEHFLGR
ncbi:MAG: S9 family peptidase [Sandaracinaceae bacterium]|nr:S9 family peptidase [Sandaracinaceae bacterium]